MSFALLVKVEVFISLLFSLRLLLQNSREPELSPYYTLPICPASLLWVVSIFAEASKASLTDGIQMKTPVMNLLVI